jgi:hypothetical protein
MICIERFSVNVEEMSKSQIKCLGVRNAGSYLYLKSINVTLRLGKLLASAFTIAGLACINLLI